MSHQAQLADERIVRLTDPDDPRITDYHSVREADLVGRRGAFVAEGEMVLRAIIERGRFVLRSVLIGPTRLRTLAPWLVRLPAAVPIYVAEPAVMNAIAGFDIHRGVLGIGERGVALDARALLSSLGPGPKLVVALDGLTNHDNVGGMFRNAAAFGVDAVLLDDRCCDPLYRKAIRVSIGAALVIPFARCESTAHMLASLREATFVSMAMSPRRDALDIASLRTPERMPARLAVLLGTEGPGLTDAAMSAAAELVRIAIHPEVDALNVSTAGAIALHEYRSVHPMAAPGSRSLR